MDIVSVSWHLNGPQDSPVSHSCSSGLYGEAGLNYDHASGGAGLGEIFHYKSTHWLIAAVQVVVIAGNGTNESTLHGMQGSSSSAFLREDI